MKQQSSQVTEEKNPVTSQQNLANYGSRQQNINKRNNKTQKKRKKQHTNTAGNCFFHLANIF